MSASVSKEKGNASIALLWFVRLPILACALAVFMLSATVASARSHLSSDPRVVHARLLIEEGQFKTALIELKSLAPDHPDRTDVLFLVGLAALRSAQLPQTKQAEQTILLNDAIAAFREILNEQPGLIRVRLELAHAFFLKRQDELARGHFERVLASNPPPAVAANIRRFIDVIEARKRWKGYVGVTLAPDSNISASSDEETIYINNLPFRLNTDVGAQSGIGILLRGGGEYQIPLSNHLRFRIGADIARREYSGSNYDQTFLSFHAGPNWFTGRKTEISLLGSARRRWLGDKPYSYELGTRFETTHRVTKQLRLDGRASWYERKFDKDTHLNGPRSAFSLRAVWLPKPTVRLESTVGYTRQTPSSLPWRNSGRSVSIDSSFALRRGFTLGVGGELIWTRYKGNWSPFTLDGASRKDRTRVLRISVFNRGWTVFGFSPKLTLVNEVRSYNAQLYDYRKNRAELGFAKQF